MCSKEHSHFVPTIFSVNNMCSMANYGLLKNLKGHRYTFLFPLPMAAENCDS